MREREEKQHDKLSSRGAASGGGGRASCGFLSRGGKQRTQMGLVETALPSVYI